MFSYLCVQFILVYEVTQNKNLTGNEKAQLKFLEYQEESASTAGPRSSLFRWSICRILKLLG